MFESFFAKDDDPGRHSQSAEQRAAHFSVALTLAIELWDADSRVDLVDRTLQFFTRLYLEIDILQKVDRASMTHSLELRAPFLDIDVVDFARRLPSTLKIRTDQTKYLLKKAMEPWLPRHLSKEAGFSVPVAQRFRDGHLNLPPAVDGGPFNADFGRMKLVEHRQRKANQHVYFCSQLILDRGRTPTVGVRSCLSRIEGGVNHPVIVPLVVMLRRQVCDSVKLKLPLPRRVKTWFSGP